MKAPPYLTAGDKVHVVAPAKIFDVDALNAGITILKSWRLDVIAGKNLFAQYHQFAGTDDERASDLQFALNDPAVKAIFCARGGYGTGRLVDELDFTSFKKNPKWVVGFSDITVLLSQINKIGIQSLHAPMPTQFGIIEYAKSVLALKNILFGKDITYTIRASKYNKWGTATAPVIGGNLTMLHCQLDTKSEVDWKDKILFLEEVGEPLYHLDRMLVHLKRTKRLKGLKGLIIGHFTEMKDAETAFGKSVEEIILDAVKEYHYPVLFQFPAGHAAPNLPIVLGREITLYVQPGKVSVAYF